MKLWCYAEGLSPSRGCCTLKRSTTAGVSRRGLIAHYV
jgi:hypothetical protein